MDRPRGGDAEPLWRIFTALIPHLGGGTAEQRVRRDLLRKAMEHDGYFFVYPEEWWHYDFKDFRDYPIQGITFSEIAMPAKSK